MYENKTECVYKDFSKVKEVFEYSLKSKYYDDSKKLVVGMMKDETAPGAIREFVRFTLKVYSFLVGDNSDHKKANYVNKNVKKISHSECKDVFFNEQCLRHSMNRIGGEMKSTKFRQFAKKQKFATIIKNAEILRFVLDHRKTKKMCTKVAIEVANSNKVCS